LKGRFSYAIDFTGDHFENRRECGFWQPDRPFVFRLDDEQMPSVRKLVSRASTLSRAFLPGP
jgi:hypothetical protein